MRAGKKIRSIPPPRAFQGYISPEVEDAIKNDHGGKYVLDFLRNKLMIIDVVLPSTWSREPFPSPVSYARVKEAMLNGAVVVVVLRIAQVAEDSSTRSSSPVLPDGSICLTMYYWATEYYYYYDEIIFSDRLVLTIYNTFEFSESEV